MASKNKSNSLIEQITSACDGSSEFAIKVDEKIIGVRGGLARDIVVDGDRWAESQVITKNGFPLVVKKIVLNDGAVKRGAASLVNCAVSDGALRSELEAKLQPGNAEQVRGKLAAERLADIEPLSGAAFAQESMRSAAPSKASNVYLIFRTIEDQIKWHEGLADLGCIKTQQQLGLIYLQMPRVFENLKHAYKWLFISVFLGNENARSDFEVVNSLLTVDEIDDAFIPVDAWFADKWDTVPDRDESKWSMELLNLVFKPSSLH